MAESSLASPLSLEDEWTNAYGDAIANNDDITALLKSLATRSGANGTLHFELPSSPMTLKCDYIDFSTGGSWPITKFGCLENGAAITIQLNGTGTTLWRFSNLYECVIGSQTAKAYTDLKLLLRGTWSLSNTGAAGDGYTYLYEGIILIVNDTYTSTGPMALRCNTRRAKGTSFQFTNSGTQKTDPGGTFYVGGEHDGGIRFGYTTCNICLEDLRLIDPFCRYRGWRGVIVNGEGECLKANAETHTAGMNWTNAIGIMYGTMETLYGDQLTPHGGFNDSTTQQMSFGTADLPLICKSTDFGWSGPEATELGWQAGVPMQKAWYFNHQGKFDGLPQHASPINWYMTHEVVVGYGPPRTQPEGYTNPGQYMFTEANAQDETAGGPSRWVSYGTWTLKNVIGSWMRGTGNYPGIDNAIHHVTYRGNGADPAQIGGTTFPYNRSYISLSIYDTAEWGQFYNVLIDESGAGNDEFRDRGSHNRLNNCSITGKITVTGTGYDNVATNILFMGVAREVVNIATGQQFYINNVSAPAGSTIGGTGTLKVNNVTKSLPYTIVAGDVTDANAIPAEIPGIIETIQQVSRPIADVSNSGWTSTKVSFYDALDEAPDVDYSDYIFTDVPGSIVVLDLNDITNPETFSLHGMQYAGDGNYKVELLQNGSVIATRNNYDTSPTKHIEFLTTTETQLIDQSYTNFQVRFTSL